MTEFEELVKRCRSYRRFYENHRLTEGELRRLINLARLSASAANLQPLKYMLLSRKEENELIFPTLKWAGYLKDWPGPGEGERPAGYIIILGDKKISRSFEYDCGIASQNILLGAVASGLGGCILGSIDRRQIRKGFNIPTRYEILLVIALGKPKEEIIIEESAQGNIMYFRDTNGRHHVPKRALNEVIIWPNLNG